MKERDLMERIRKLLRLGNRTNHEGERGAALAKAAELAAAAGIALGEVDAGEGEIKVGHEFVKLKRVNYTRRLVFWILKEHFGVRVLCRSGDGYMYIGPAVNIEIAKHVEVYLLREAQRAWVEFKGGYLGADLFAKPSRRDFDLGFFTGIYAAMRRRPLRNDLGMVQGAIDMYVERNFKVKALNPKTAEKVDGECLDGGWDAGKRVNLSRPVEGSGGVVLALN